MLENFGDVIVVKMQWVYSPVCDNKTRLKVREETELKNFPLFCPKCKNETLVDVKEFKMTIIKECQELKIRLPQSKVAFLLSKRCCLVQ